MNKNVLYVLLLLGGGVYYGYDTYYPEFVGWETEITELQKNIDQARRTAPKLAEIKVEEQQLQERLALSLEKLPSGSELDNLLTMITPILEGVGIQSNQIGSKNVSPATEKDIYRTHSIRLGDIKGVSMQTIVQLLFEIRNFHRIINVNSYTMTRTGPDDYTLNLDLETYSYIAPEGEELPTPAASAAPAAPAAPSAPAAPAPATPAAASDTASAAAPGAPATAATPAAPAAGGAH